MKNSPVLYRLLRVVLVGISALLWPMLTTAGYEQVQAEDSPDFAFSIAANMSSDEELRPGSTITYSLTLSNTGAMPLSNVAIAALIPRYTTAAPPVVSQWQCAPPAGQPDRQICRVAFATVPLSETIEVTLTVVISTSLPPQQESLIFEANATADDVVCGDCGYAWCETPILHGSGDLERRIFLPWIGVRPL